MTPPDFDKLSHDAFAQGSTMDDKNALWGAAFDLEKWHFIARGEFPDVHPYVASNASVDGGRPMIKAFTDAKKLHAFAHENKLTDEKGEVLFLSLPVAGFVDRAENYLEMGVHGIHFNADLQSNGFFSPLVQLAPIRDHLARLKQGP